MHRRGVRIAGLAAIAVALGVGLPSLVGAHAGTPRAGATGATFAPLVPLRRSWPEGIAGPGRTVQIAVSVSRTETGPAMPLGFLGFSIEYSSLRQYLGTDPRAVDPVFLHLVEALNPVGGAVLRIGGDSTDHTWWPRPGVKRPPGVSFSLSRNWLAVTRAMADELGAHLILGVNLAADSAPDAHAEADALVTGISSRNIAGLEIGNEPDIYGHATYYRTAHGVVVHARPGRYDFADYLHELSRWIRLLPRGVRSAGPAFALPGWMSHLSTLLDRNPGLRIVTYHRYPLRACDTDRSLATYPTIPRLLADSSSLGLAEQVAADVSVAHAHGRPFRLDELNSASCTGKLGVSNTFASSLWVLDTLFDLAAVGTDGVNVHTLTGAPYEPFAFSQTGGRWSASVKPLYYGMLMFARAFPAGARSLEVQAPQSAIKAYATKGAAGVLRIVLINKSMTSSAEVHLRLAGLHSPLALQWLLAPSISATRGVTLDGQTFGSSTSTGVLPAPDGCGRVPRDSSTCATSSLGRYTIRLPAGSAVLLTPAAS